MQINFISSLDPGKIRTMDSKNNNVEVTMGNETDDIIKELFKSFLENYQKNLEEKMKDNKFLFQSVDLLHYSLHKTTLRSGKSYIKSPKWLGNKGATINLQNYDENNCFQYAITIVLNHQNIENPP